MSRGKRYDTQPKLNMKKVIAVIVAILVIIMFVVGIKQLLSGDNSVKQKTFAVGYYAVNDDGKWGVIDTKQNILIAPTYEEMIVVPDNSKPVFIITTNVDYESGEFDSKAVDNNNKQLFTEYSKVEAIYNQDKSNNLWYEKNILKVQKDNKYGLINLDGKELLPCEYDEIKAVLGVKNVLQTTKDGKLGIVDNTGKIIIKNEFDQIDTITDKYEDGFIVKLDNGKYSILSTTGETAVEGEFEDVKKVAGNKMYVVKQDGTWKIIDKDGKTYLDNEFDDVKQINLGNVVVKKDNKYGIVSVENEVKLDYQYDDLTFIFTDTYIAKKDDKYGIITTGGAIKLPFEYTSIKYETEADFIRAQKQDSQSQLLDREFNVKAEGIVSEINLEKNYIRLRVQDEYKYYNFKLEEKESTEIISTNTIFLSKKDGKYGYVDEKGIVVVDYIYDDATEQNKYGYVSVKKDGKWGCLDQKGKVVVEPTYTLENNIVVDFIGEWHLAEDLNANYYCK